jgi:hypothetical protein
MRRSRKWLSAASVVAPAALLLFFAFSSAAGATTEAALNHFLDRRIDGVCLHA